MRRSFPAFAAAAVAAAAFAACGGQGDDAASSASSNDTAASLNKTADTAATAAAGNATAQTLIRVSSGTVIRNAVIVDPRNGSLQAGKAVIIEQGRIKQIAINALVLTSGSARSIDAAGKYLVPGYLDMHTHSMPFANAPVPHWPLMIANGVTGIREMAGSPELLAAASQVNTSRAAGTLDAPEILQMPGPVTAGAITAADGVAAVQATQAMGGAFVKVISVGPAAQAAILNEARARNLKVAGHLSAGTTAVDTVNGGWYAIEHLGGNQGIQLDCSTDQAAIRGALLSGQGARPPFPATYTVLPTLYSALDAPFYQRAADTYSDSLCQNVARTVVQKGTWQAPTMLRLRAMFQPDSAEFRNDANLKYVEPTLRGLWQQLSSQFSQLQPTSAQTTFRNYNGQYVKMLKLLRQNGGAKNVLAGTDVGGIWIIPGFALHQEFRELAAAGFTPLEVLQATTINGARFLNRESTMGTVEAGKNANLVLLDANPLSNVANLSKISGVVNGGKYFAKADLDALKAGVASAYANAPMRDVNSVLDQSHKH